jgi:hypothetical protein
MNAFPKSVARGAPPPTHDDTAAPSSPYPVCCSSFARRLHVCAQVCVYFHKKLMTGSRVVKSSSESWDAFTMPRATILGEFVGQHPTIRSKPVFNILRQRWSHVLWYHHFYDMNFANVIIDDLNLAGRLLRSVRRHDSPDC